MALKQESRLEGNRRDELWTSPRWNWVLRSLGGIAALHFGWLAYQQLGEAGYVRFLVYGGSAILLVLPWSLFATKWWKRLFPVLILSLIVNIPMQVTEVLHGMSEATERDPESEARESLHQSEELFIPYGDKPPAPIDRGVTLFLGLLQIPAILFRRYPKILD